MGSALRCAVSLASLALFSAGFPREMLAVNILGSLAIGAVAAHGIGGPARLPLVPGLLGGFTTFPAFCLETTFLRHCLPRLALLHVVLSVRLGAAAYIAGFRLFRR
nr:CrcB family protein [Roseomonas rosulenta]